MSSKVLEAQNRAKLNAGAYQFFRSHPEVWSADANVALLSEEVLLKGLPMDQLASWEAAYETLKPNLATKPAEIPVVEVEEQPSWPYDFPQISTPGDIKRMDPKLYKDLWFESDRGKLTERAEQFRAVVNAILNKINEGRRR